MCQDMERGAAITQYFIWDLINHGDSALYYSAQDDVMVWKRFLHYQPFVRGILRSRVPNIPHDANCIVGLKLQMTGLTYD